MTMTASAWEAVKDDLRQHYGGDVFRNWIEPLQYRGLDGVHLQLGAPSKFFSDWVERSYGTQILDSYRAHDGRPMRLEFIVSSNAIPSPAAQTNVTAAPETSARPALPKNHLDARYRFDKFVVGKSNELAYNAARRLAEGGEASFNPLFLYSGVGLGKTHLMHAIAWELQSNFPEKRVLFLSAEKFMYQFVSALRSKSMHGFKELFRSVDILLVDDVQFIAGKESTQDEFFYTFNALIEQNKQIVISADRAPGDLEGVEERIKSRLQSGLMVDIHPTDYELRLGILQSKLETAMRDFPNVSVDDGVLEFLARRISSNVRVLEGSLTRLVAYADLSGKPASLDLAYDTLSDILRVSKTKLTLEAIIKAAAESYNLRISDLVGARRTQAIARPRQIAMYLCKQLTSKSLPDIGRAFGGRDHTTVIHAVRKIEDLVRHDGHFAEEVETLRRRVEA